MATAREPSVSAVSVNLTVIYYLLCISARNLILLSVWEIPCRTRPSGPVKKLNISGFVINLYMPKYRISNGGVLCIDIKK